MASDTSDSATRLDVSAFAKAGAVLEGTWTAGDLPRLAESVQGLHGAVHWMARGIWKQPVGRDPEIRLKLQVTARVGLVCQRCLSALEVPLSVDQVILFVRGAEEAEQLDETSEDEDVLELPRRLHLRDLIEDELILALPLIPRHDLCPELPAMVYGEAELQDAETEPQAHPFAALAALRADKPPN
jgi:uncharacterized protein